MRFHLLAIVAVASISTCAEAQCQSGPLAQTSSGLNVQMATMNRLGVASYAVGSLAYRRAIPALHSPAHWQSVAPMPQTFADRYVTAPTPVQNFDVSKADKISLQFTTGANPQGMIILSSHGNASSSFPVTCSNTGIAHGVTGDVEYLFYFSVQQPIQ